LAGGRRAAAAGTHPPVPTTPTHLHVPAPGRDRGLRPLRPSAGFRAGFSVSSS